MNNILLISIPNGGKRSYWAGRQEVAMGLTAGVSDLFLPVVTDVYPGFWIEMKAPGNTPRIEQYHWLRMMRDQGYKAEWYDDWEKAKLAIEDYLCVKKQSA
jgi:hypothetical protein